MAALGSMWIKSCSGLSRAARAYLCARTHRAGELMRTSTTAANADGKTAEQVEAEGDAPPPSQATTEAAAAEKVLKEEKKKLEEDLKELKDKYIRSLAETENVRQRMKKQIDDAKLYGIQGFCKDLIEVADILNAATLSVPKEYLTTENPHLKSLYDGLIMTETQLQKVFGKHGMQPISPAEGEKFDPNIHEALFQVPTNDKEDNAVAIVQKIGYRLHDRTLRPAMVGVFKAT